VGDTTQAGTIDRCALCGQPALGFGMADGRRLCHDVQRDCYHRWTVYGQRSPGIFGPQRPVGSEGR
jgi:hypothetical protein